MNKQRKADLKKFNLIKEMMCDVKPDMDAPLQFWHFIGNYHAEAAREASRVRKEEVAKKFEAFVKKEVPEAFDVASNWGPMSGFGIDGIIFEAENAKRTDKRFVQPMQEVPGYAAGKSCYLGRVSTHTEEGLTLSDKLEKLLVDVQGPIEFSDFVLDGFGLHKAVGSNIVNGKRVMIPPRVFFTVLGLFICVPKERLYEMPAGFEPVCQSLVAFSQDVMAMFANEDAQGEATMYDVLNQGSFGA